MKKIVILLSMITCVIMVITSCGASKQITKSKSPQYTDPFAGGAYELPCSVYDDEENFAATGIASGPATRKGALQMTALKNAQDLVAMKIQHAVEGEVKSFFESVGSNQGTDVDEQTIGGINNIILGVVNNTSSCCQMFSGVDEKGNVECYVGIKISKQEIANAVADNLSENKKEDIRERAEKFRKQLADDLKNLDKYIEE